MELGELRAEREWGEMERRLLKMWQLSPQNTQLSGEERGVCDTGERSEDREEVGTLVGCEHCELVGTREV